MGSDVLRSATGIGRRMLGIGAIFGDNLKLEQRTYYLNHLSADRQMPEKPRVWIQRYMNLEFGNVDFNFFVEESLDMQLLNYFWNQLNLMIPAWISTAD